MVSTNKSLAQMNKSGDLGQTTKGCSALHDAEREFDLQDEITKKVVAPIEPKLLEAEAFRSRGRSPEDLGPGTPVMHTNPVLWRLTKPLGA